MKSYKIVCTKLFLRKCITITSLLLNVFLIGYIIQTNKNNNSITNEIIVEKETIIEKEKLVTDNLIEPLEHYAITSNSGERQDPMGGVEYNFHRGVDLVPLSKNSNNIKCIDDGVVEVHYPPPDGYFKGHPVYGALIIIKHNNGLYSLYAHMSETYVRTGDKVTKGQIIGKVGNTGISTGPHLHFEVFLNPDFLITQLI